MISMNDFDSQNNSNNSKAVKECNKLINRMISERNNSRQKKISEIYNDQYIKNLYKCDPKCYLSIYQYSNFSSSSGLHFKVDNRGT